MKIHFIIHEKFEGPGVLLIWAEKHNYDISFSRVYLYESLPDLQDFDLLIVLGGPQSTNTSLSEFPYFDVEKEKELISDAISNNKAVVGICLGAQLVGEALGSPATKSPQKEIGVFPIILSATGKQNPIFHQVPQTVNVGHWHGDMPGLTTESKVIATSNGCPRQIIEYSKFVYGFQCHLEFTPESVKQLISHSEEELERSKDEKYVQPPTEFIDYDYNEMNNLLFGFLDNLIMEFGAHRKN